MFFSTSLLPRLLVFYTILAVGSVSRRVLASRHLHSRVEKAMRFPVAPTTAWLFIQLLVGDPLYVYEAVVLTAMPPAAIMLLGLLLAPQT